MRRAAAAGMTTGKWPFLMAAAFACAEPATEIGNQSRATEPRAQRDTASRPAATENDNMISRAGVGGIRLGMTLAEARRVFPLAVFARATDGDGAALVKVTLAPNQTLMLWADEDDADAAIDWGKTVQTIEAFDSAFHTREGVRPGTPVSEVESIYGRIRAIRLSEIESRQYISFTAQPEYLTLRLNYTGIFAGNERTTTALRPDARIMSISVSSYVP